MTSVGITATRGVAVVTEIVNLPAAPPPNATITAWSLATDRRTAPVVHWSPHIARDGLWRRTAGRDEQVSEEWCDIVASAIQNDWELRWSVPLDVVAELRELARRAAMIAADVHVPLYDDARDLCKSLDDLATAVAAQSDPAGARP